jgi:hypothetical protein
MYSRILICGGRRFDSQEHFQNVMVVMQPMFAPRFCIFEGGANGADRMAQIWARLNGYPQATMPANWNYYGYGAGTKRNTDMLDFFLPDVVIAMPGGKGTADMVKQSLERGIAVFQ